ncbi:hypothetical protein GCM10009836_43830 [Pseudonocardia ailaonensis]|uniref:ABC transporter permease n=1 Tax=Pseudonocardia ailaonensis TaxID=367279 RepID=A0ABN2NAS4_9PSEU
MSNAAIGARQSVDPDPSAPPGSPTGPSRGRRSSWRLARGFGVDRFSGLYVAILLIVVFSLLDPVRFGTLNNFRIIAASQAITGILVLGLIISLLSGVFDISIAANMTLAISFVGWLQASGLNAGLAVLITLCVGAAVGATNAAIILFLKVDPVIATLGTSSILAALTYWIAQGNTIVDGISPTFAEFGRYRILTIPAPVFYFLGIALILWYVLEHTPAGRYMYAIGSNAEAARLSGLKVRRLQWIALISSGVLGAFAGVVLTMQLGAASYGAGAPYLLTAFAVAFLGSTQVRPGRFNVGGTIVALYLLAIGVKGLELQYPSLPWIKDLFVGAALIVAVAIGARAALRRANPAAGRRSRRRAASGDDGASAVAEQPLVEPKP